MFIAGTERSEMGGEGKARSEGRRDRKREKEKKYIQRNRFMRDLAHSSPTTPTAGPNVVEAKNPLQKESLFFFFFLRFL